MQRRSLLLGTAALAALPALAQGKPYRLIVPFAPGGPLDVTARALAERVRETLGTVVVENRPGAGGNLGADLVAQCGLPAEHFFADAFTSEADKVQA